MNSKQKIVGTGFGPFEGNPVNSSWESVKPIHDLWKHDQVDVLMKFQYAMTMSSRMSATSGKIR